MHMKASYLATCLFILSYFYSYAYSTDSTIILHIPIETEIKKIKVDFKKVKIGQKISSLIDLKTYTQLERNENRTIIGSPRKVILDVKHIYVLDPLSSSQVFVFDRSGKFKFLLGGSGEGPGSYKIPWDIFIDPKNNTAEVLDGERMRIIVFNASNGKFIKSISLPHPTPAFTKLGQNYALYGNNEAYHLSIVNESGKIVKTYIPNNKTRNVLMFDHFNRLSDKNSLFRMTGTNIIYSVLENTVTPHLEYDFGPYNYTKAFASTLPEQVRDNPHASVDQKVIRIETHAESKNTIFFSFFLKGTKYFGLYDKGSENLQLHKNMINDFTFQDKFFGLLHAEKNSDFFSGIILPGHKNDLLIKKYSKNPNTTKLFNNFSEKKSNPIVYRIKFKRF